MAHSPDIKMKLRAAYIGGLPLEAAADKVGIPLPTARNWYRAARDEGDDWDAFQKASLVVSGGGIEQALGRIIAAGLLRCDTLLTQMESADPMEGVKAIGVLGDTVSKLKAASKGMMPEADRLGVAMDVLKRQAKFVAENYPQHQAAFVEILGPFGEEIAKVYG